MDQDNKNPDNDAEVPETDPADPSTAAEGAAEDAADAAANDDAALETDDAEAEQAPEEDAGDDPETQIRELNDRLLRTMAEMENLRRRTQKEKEDTAKFAASGFARDMLSIADNLHRALEAAPDGGSSGGTDEGVAALIEGVKLTEKDLLAAFERHGVERVDPMGQKFNHDLHEAMFEIPSADAEAGTVLQVVEVGYTLNGRLLRPARVGIAKAAPPPGDTVDTTA